MLGQERKTEIREFKIIALHKTAHSNWNAATLAGVSHLDHIKPIPMITIALAITGLDKAARLLNGSNPAIADVFYELWSVKKFENELSVRISADLAYEEPICVQD